MKQFLLPALALASSIAIGGCLHAPMPWSPDGRWIAYTVEVRPIEKLLTPGWLFESPTSPTRATIPPGRPTGYRLWATRGTTGTSVLLEESSRPMTAPGWSPDGRALAFGRVVAEADGSGRFETVILEGPDRRRVISSRPLAEIGGRGRQAPRPGHCLEPGWPIPGDPATQSPGPHDHPGRQRPSGQCDQRRFPPLMVARRDSPGFHHEGDGRYFELHRLAARSAEAAGGSRPGGPGPCLDEGRPDAHHRRAKVGPERGRTPRRSGRAASHPPRHGDNRRPSGP